MRRTILFAAVFFALTALASGTSPAAEKKMPRNEEMKRAVQSLAALEAYLAKGRDVNEVDEKGNALIHHVAEKKSDPALIDLLVAKGANVDQPGTTEIRAIVNEEDEHGRRVESITTRAETPLFMAARSRNARVALALMKHGATAKGRATELMMAYFNSQNWRYPNGRRVTPDTVELLDILLRAGADPNYGRDNGDTPLGLLLARSEPTPEALDLLLRHGANPNVGLRYIPPLCQPNLRMWEVEKLVAAGAAVNVTDKDGFTPLHVTADPAIAEFLCAKGANPDGVAKDNRTSLAEAINHERFAVAKVLLNHNASTAFRGDRGANLLQWTIEKVRTSQWVSISYDTPEKQKKRAELLKDGDEVLGLLMQRGVSPNDRDERGRTVLFYLGGDDKTLPMFLAHGADPRLADNEGRTILHEYRAISPAALDTLIAAGANVKARDRHGNSVLHGRWDAPTIKALLERGAEVDAVNDEGRSPLAVACRNFPEYGRNTGVLELLIAAGAKVDRRDAKGLTPLLLAMGVERDKKASGSSDQHTNPARVLLDHGANPDAGAPDGDAPLLIAVTDVMASGTLKLLIEHGANPNVQDKNGNSTLHRLAGLEFFFGCGDHFFPSDDVESLLAHGAQVNLPNHSGLTPLDFAESLRRHDLAQLLKKHGGRTTAPADRHVELLRENVRFIAQDPKLIERYLAQGGAIDDQDEFQGTMLHYAAWYGKTDAVKLLLKRGANPKARANGHTPMDLAADSGQAGIVPLLSATSGKADRQTLAAAAASGSLATVKELVKAKASLDSRNSQGYTALDLALEHGHFDVVEYLIDQGAKVATECNHTMIIACLSTNRAIVEKLLAHGGDIRTGCDGLGATPLSAAAAGGKKDIVELLLARGYPVNDLKNCTLGLFTAMEHKQLALMEILIRHGAAMEEGENNERTIAFLRASNRADLVELLAKNNAAFEKQMRQHPDRNENESREDDE